MAPTTTTTADPNFYYQGLICGGGIAGYFRSATNLGDNPGVIYGFSATAGNTNQCFDTVSRIYTPNTNDIIAVFDDCTTCYNTENPTTTTTTAAPAPTTTTTAAAPYVSCYTYGDSITYNASCYYSGTDDTLVVTISLKDQYGSPINATSNMTFSFSYDYDDVQDVGGGTGTGTQDLIVYSGNSFGQTTFYPKTYQYCNYSSVCNGSCYYTQYNITLTSAPISAC